MDTSSNAGCTTSYASFDCAHNSFSLSHTDSYTSPQFTAPPTDVVVANGETATLQCGVAGQPPPSVTWFREGGGEVTSGGRFTVGSTTGELTISSVELSDEGEYYCVAGNAVGSVRSLSASLQLAGNNPPRTMFTYKILCLFSGSYAQKTGLDPYVQERLCACRLQLSPSSRLLYTSPSSMGSVSVWTGSSLVDLFKTY